MLKIIWDTYTDRPKNPWLGPLFLSFIAINWQIILYFIYSDADILDKIEYFDKDTNLGLMYCSVIFSTVFITIAFPWIKLGFFKVNSLPNETIQKWAINSKIKIENHKSKYIEIVKQNSEKTALLSEADQIKVMDKIDDVIDGTNGESDVTFIGLESYFIQNSLENKTQKQKLLGTAKYLTEKNKQFTKQELFDELKNHSSYTLAFVKNQSANFNKLLKDTDIKEFKKDMYKSEP